MSDSTSKVRKVRRVLRRQRQIQAGQVQRVTGRDVRAARGNVTAARGARLVGRLNPQTNEGRTASLNPNRVKR